MRRAEGDMRRLLRGVEATVEAIIMTDTKGDIFYVNPAFTVMTGYQPHEVLGKNPRLLNSGVHPTRFYRDLWSTILCGDTWSGEVTNRRKDGSLYDASVTIAPVSDNHGVGEGFVAVQADITERKRSEEALRHLTEVLQDQADELKRSNEELEQFAYVASHDLQEPLRMVASFTQLLEKRYGDRLDADGREFIAYAVDGTHRMQALIHALLAFSRVGSRDTPRTPVDLQQVFAGVLANLRTAIAESGATITATPLPVVTGDAVQLGQLLQNLVSNAVKFRGERPLTVHVAAERDGDEWHCTVRDNGIGIAPQYADRIFVIFQRLHTRDRYEGTGIGLAICKKIVGSHGGRMWVESLPDAGATFHFTLPIETTDASMKRARATDRGSSATSDAHPSTA
jgi:chemotaxis family two-component system sensor kinase Cph1